MVARQPADPVDLPPWGPQLLTITISPTSGWEGTNCFGYADGAGELTRFSECASPVKGPFCQSVRIPFAVLFYVDREGQERPQPFPLPPVSARFDFTNAGGRNQTLYDVKDPSPKRALSGGALAPSFGRDFPAGATESGTLKIRLELDDPAAKVVYDDSIAIEVTPCV